MSSSTFPGSGQFGNYQRPNNFDNGPRDQNQGGFQKQGFNKGGGGKKFERKPDTDLTVYFPYAVFANRDCPIEIINKFGEIARNLSARGYTARTGGALDGIDPVVVENSLKNEEILPWWKFNEKDSKFCNVGERAIAVAKHFHQTWENVSEKAHKFFARNARMVMGDRLISPALFIIVWSEDGVENMREATARSGNVYHPIRIADGSGIPIFNIGNPNFDVRFKNYIDARQLK